MLVLTRIYKGGINYFAASGNERDGNKYLQMVDIGKIIANGDGLYPLQVFQRM